MAVFPAGFSERVFEFGFNTEYAANNKAVLAAAPFIPTQNAETALGFDVEFAIKAHGGAVRYLALQHKVARHVTGHSPSNVHFRKAMSGPYYAFGVDPVQFNLIEEVATSAPSYVEFYYCAPVFHGISAMNAHYLANSVESNSIWIDVAGIGQLHKEESHTMVYGPASAFVFSEDGRPAQVRRPSERTVEGRQELQTHDPREAYEWLFASVTRHYSERVQIPAGRRAESIRDLPMGPPVRRDVDKTASAIEALGEIVSRYLDSTLLIEVRK